ncbi:MAG: hypothetical protein AB1894_05345 [Chloroflexota bacterium]
MPEDQSKIQETLQSLSRLGEFRENQPSAALHALEPGLVLLRTWQSQRLAQTYTDLLAHSRYAPACRFFLSDVYAARDFSQRDHDILYLYQVMSRFVPDFMLKLIRSVIELNNLSADLDHALLHVLVEELGVVDAITPQQYAAGYRICDNYTERVHQIEMIVSIGQQIDRTVRLPLVGATLRLARRPAHSAGWGELQDFLERGYAAFKHMGRASIFLKTIQQREMRILDDIFAGKTDPFR